MKKNNIAWAVVLLISVMLQSCNDFFETTPRDVISESDYIAKDDEMYKGFLGIINRVQEAGDQSIFLTDTRCNFLEVTENAPVALQNIYNYNNTDGNEYADPTCYYAIVIACNDYIEKMKQYAATVGGVNEISSANFYALLSNTLRIKVWAYYMLGRIYGTAYWFDDPLTEIKDLSNTEVFTKCDMKMLADKCIDLLNNGITIDAASNNIAIDTANVKVSAGKVHIPSDITMKWYTWLDEENQSESSYLQWQYITPPSIILEAEFRSWRASYESEEAAKSDWLWIRDNLLAYMYKIHTATAGSKLPIPGFDIAAEGAADLSVLGYVYQTNIPLQSDGTYPYYTIFCSEEVGNKLQLISGIMYDYTNHQRNRLVQYFCPTYPSNDAFYLQPSVYGKELYNEEDIRSLTQKMVMNTLGGKDALTKYYYSYNTSTRTYKYLRENLFEIEPTIITFRGHDLHFLLAEAENHLGNWRQAKAILNMGLNNEFADKIIPEDWSPYYNSWFGASGGYGDVGIVGAARGKVHQLPTPEDAGYNLTEDQRKQIYDWAIADEYLKEYVAEGKSYSYLCKIAERYAQNGIRGGSPSAARSNFSERIAPKYTSASMQQKVKNYISSNGYFIQWNLKD